VFCDNLLKIDIVLVRICKAPTKLLGGLALRHVITVIAFAVFGILRLFQECSPR